MNKARMVKWLLVDIGDVLLLKERREGKSFGQLLADELSIDLELAQLINKEHYSTMETKRIPEADFTKSLEIKLGYAPQANIYSYFERAYRKQVHANVELMDFLEGVRKMGIKTAVLSNTIAIYQSLQEELGISKVRGFDPIVYSWEVGMRKPDAGIFALTLEKLNANPDEVIFIDDKLEHLEGARKVGIRTLQYHTNEEIIEKIRRILEEEL